MFALVCGVFVRCREEPKVWPSDCRSSDDAFALRGKASTMLIYFLAFVPFINTFHGVTAGQPHGETRMDYGEHYIPYQDITKAFNTSKKQWLYGANFEIPSQYQDYKCVNFRKDRLSDQELNFTAYYMKSSEYGATRLYGKLSKDISGAETDKAKIRTGPNSIEVSSKPDFTEGTKFRLIYSNAKNCSILRVPSQLGGRGCIVLLTIDTVKKGLPRFCNTTYHNACGTQYKFYQVFSDDCKLTENPVGC
uniref:Putative licpodalin-4 1 n=1 Tax=Amblyomma triste TaxID=251400 RepID=A0A023G7Y4_AMBTT